VRQAELTGHHVVVDTHNGDAPITGPKVRGEVATFRGKSNAQKFANDRNRQHSAMLEQHPGTGGARAMDGKGNELRSDRGHTVGTPAAAPKPQASTSIPAESKAALDAERESRRFRFHKTTAADLASKHTEAATAARAAGNDKLAAFHVEAAALHRSYANSILRDSRAETGAGLKKEHQARIDAHIAKHAALHDPNREPVTGADIAAEHAKLTEASMASLRGKLAGRNLSEAQRNAIKAEIEKRKGSASKPSGKTPSSTSDQRFRVHATQDGGYEVRDHKDAPDENGGRTVRTFSGKSNAAKHANDLNKPGGANELDARRRVEEHVNSPASRGTEDLQGMLSGKVANPKGFTREQILAELHKRNPSPKGSLALKPGEKLNATTGVSTPSGELDVPSEVIRRLSEERAKLASANAANAPAAAKGSLPAIASREANNRRMAQIRREIAKVQADRDAHQASQASSGSPVDRIKDQVPTDSIRQRAEVMAAAKMRHDKLPTTVRKDDSGDHVVDHGATGLMTDAGTPRWSINSHTADPNATSAPWIKDKATADKLAARGHHISRLLEALGSQTGRDYRSDSTRLSTVELPDGTLHVSNYDNGRGLGFVAPNGETMPATGHKRDSYTGKWNQPLVSPFAQSAAPAGADNPQAFVGRTSTQQLMAMLGDRRYASWKPMINAELSKRRGEAGSGGSMDAAAVRLEAGRRIGTMGTQLTEGRDRYDGTKTKNVHIDGEHAGLVYKGEQRTPVTGGTRISHGTHVSKGYYAHVKRDQGGTEPIGHFKTQAAAIRAIEDHHKRKKGNG
jgi:hypothetical protein